MMPVRRDASEVPWACQSWSASALAVSVYCIEGDSVDGVGRGAGLRERESQHKRKQAKNRAAELLEQLGLAERAGHKPYQLSGGERQRVAIGRALMNEPTLLLADEPTGNLDSATGNSILDALERLNQAGQTIIMVTHDERIAKRANRIITLADGKIVGT